MTKLSQSAADSRIIIGKIGAPHGIKGEVRVIPMTDFPHRFEGLQQVYVGDELLDILEMRYHKNFVLLHFKQYPLRDDVERLTGKLLTVERKDAAPLADGEYYTFDIIGLEVFDEAGQRLGVVREVLKTGSNDVYVISAPDREDLLLPAIASVILQISVPEGRMLVRPMEEFLS